MNSIDRRHKSVSHNRLQDSHDHPEGLQFTGPSFYVGPKTLATIVKIVSTALVVLFTLK